MAEPDDYHPSHESDPPNEPSERNLERARLVIGDGRPATRREVATALDKAEQRGAGRVLAAVEDVDEDIAGVLSMVKARLSARGGS